MKKRALVILIVVIAITVIIMIKKGSKPSAALTESGKITEAPATPVNTAPVKRMVIDQSVRLAGTLCAWKEIKIASEAQGTIEFIDFETGHVKTKGDVLARIDSRLKELAVENAKINAEKLKTDLDRIENLFKGGTASQQDIDNARYAFTNAEIALSEAQKQLDDATVKSPLTGVIVEKNAESGSYISIGSPVAKIVDISRLKVKLNVSEKNAYRLRIGDKTTITADVYPGVSFEGTISFISSQGDDAHNYPLEITMTNSKLYPLKAGTFVSVEMNITEEKPHLYIPRKSLQGSTMDASVYVVDNGKSVLRKVSVGSETGEYIEIVSGLIEGDIVITAGQINLTDGKKVAVVNK